MAKAKSKKKSIPPVTALTALPGKRIPVAVKKHNTEWSEFHLSDGSKIRCRQLVIDVNRVEGQYAQDGQPVYEVKGGTIMEVVAPKKLRRV